MTSQEKKEYLSQYLKSEREADQIKEEIYRLGARACNVTPAISFAPGGGGGDRIQESVEQIVEFQNRLAVQLQKSIHLREEIEAALQSVPDAQLRILLRHRYIEGMTWEQIAVAMNYSYMQVCRLHGKALDVIECYTRPVI